MAPETAGDPTSERKWKRSSLRALSTRLEEIGYRISAPTVSRLLQKNDYSMKVNVKSLEGSSHPDRNTQFDYIEEQKAHFQVLGLPRISVDTKKKELIGDFKNAGQAWCKEAEYVNVHDFPQDALGHAITYGVYEMERNRGHAYVGKSADTPEFAVDAIARWWETEGSRVYGGANHLLILADAGGSNSCRFRGWKQQLQQNFCDRYGMKVTVCHYPTGCSKWNPIEHRLFSQISINWAGKPLRTYETMLSYIRGTTTETGLTVGAFLLEGDYKKGMKVTNEEMKKLNIVPHAICPIWNYTFEPRDDYSSLKEI